VPSGPRNDAKRGSIELLISRSSPGALAGEPPFFPSKTGHLANLKIAPLADVSIRDLCHTAPPIYAAMAPASAVTLTPIDMAAFMIAHLHHALNILYADGKVTGVLDWPVLQSQIQFLMSPTRSC
jgi:hypothetical protein